MRTLPDASVQCIVVDPPYGTQDLGIGYGRRQLHTTDGRNSACILNDRNLDALQGAFQHFERLMPNGWAFVFHHPRNTPDFIAATSASQWFGTIIWDKLQPGLGYTVRYAHEHIALFRIGEPAKPESAIMSVLRAHGRGETGHIHEKPVEVLQSLIRWGCPVGGTVLDCFAGSASTGEAALREGRNFIGIELDDHWYEVGKARLEKYSRAHVPSLFAEVE
jgi:site-specific DNA-methyltransferase (adenine-specific)